MGTNLFAMALVFTSLALHAVLLGCAAVVGWRRVAQRRIREPHRLRPAVCAPKDEQGGRESGRPGGGRPKFSVLKPLAGADDELFANLQSFAALQGARYELLLGVVSLTDAAVPVARALIAASPHLDARLVVTDPRAAVNPKVAQLIGLAAVATSDVLVVSDSNVRVEPTYLQSLERELEHGRREPGRSTVGLVTSLFVGTGERSLGAALENLQLTAYVAPAVTASALFSRKPLTVGKSMAIRRAVLDSIGGFASVGGVLAEDHLLGRRVREAGHRVRVCFELVENRNVDCDTSRAIERHTRWAKMRRAIAPVPFALEPLGDPLVVAALVAALLPSPTTLLMLAFVLPWKISTAYLVTWVVRGVPLPLRYMPLEVVRSAATLFCWTKACVSRRISWRGHPFVLGRDSKIAPIAEPTVRRPRSA